MHAADAASGLPGHLLVGVSPSAVYAFAAHGKQGQPSALAFQVPPRA